MTEQFSQNLNSEERVTNLEFLSSLAMGKIDFFNEMICLFLEECPNEVSRIRVSIEEQDIQRIHAHAHAMKSSVPFVGLDTKLLPILEEIETSSDLVKIKELFLIVESVCAKAVEELKN